MKQNVTECDFHDAFRAVRPNSFTPNGLTALYEWLVELEEDTGEEMELDVIAICCDFSEFDNAIEAAGEYGHETTSEEQALDWLNDNTATISFPGNSFAPGGVIIQGF